MAFPDQTYSSNAAAASGIVNKAAAAGLDISGLNPIAQLQSAVANLLVSDPSTVTIPAGDVLSGTFGANKSGGADTGTYTFPGALTITGALTGVTSLAMAGALTGVTTIAVSSSATITSASNAAFAVGLTGASNSAFKVDASTALQVAGLKVTGAVTGGTVAIVVTDSGAAANLIINALGTGTIGIGSVSTGAVTITPATTITGALTQTGLATFNGGATVANGQTLTVTGATITGLTAASVGAGTFPSGAFVFGGALSGITTLAIGGALSGCTTITGSSTLALNATTSSALTIQNTGTGQVSIGRGAVVQPLMSGAIGSLGTTQNSTPTIAQLLAGIVTQTGQTGAGTVTLPTGTATDTGVTGAANGDTFDCHFFNLGGGFNLTITAGASGSTVVGNAVVPSGKSVLLRFIRTGSTAWSTYCIVGA